jgi:hypothetical protein
MTITDVTRRAVVYPLFAQAMRQDVGRARIAFAGQ